MYYLQSRYYNPVVGRFVNVDEAIVLNVYSYECLYGNLFAFSQNNPVNNRDIFGFLVIPRWIITFLIDFILSFAGIGFLFAPVKAAASTLGKGALKAALKTPFTKVIQFLGKCVLSLIGFLVNLVCKIPFVGGLIGKTITFELQQKLTASLVGAAVSVTVNKMLAIFIVNIDVLLSIGGFVGGLCEMLFDKKFPPLDGKIVI